MNATQLALLLAVLAPWLALTALALPALRRRATILLPLAALPALLLALAGPDPDAGIVLPGLLDQARLALDGTARAFLLPGALLWLLAGAYAHRHPLTHPLRFAVFWLLTLAGYLLLVLAADLLTFYAGFALMTFAAYGLVTHAGSATALRAGRLYLGLMLIGEVALFTAVAWTTMLAGPGHSPDLAGLGAEMEPAAALLFAIGFGLKLGAPGLHAWLPRAHAVAPVPASAVLSGVMIKVGALGAWRLLEGGLEIPGHGDLILTALGLTGTLYAVAAGLRQSEPKTILAWSSVSQMGLVVALLGMGAAGTSPGAPPAAVWAGLAVMLAHHGLAKGALFLGTGLLATAADRFTRRTILLGLALAGAALAAAPLSGGALAKAALTNGMPGWLAGLTGTATALLMLHFLRHTASDTPESDLKPTTGAAVGIRGMTPWLLTLVAGLLLPWWLADTSLREYALTASAIGDGVWPLLLAGILAGGAWWQRSRWPGIGRVAARPPEPDRSAPRTLPGMARLAHWWTLTERQLHRWPVIGRVATTMILLLALALAFSATPALFACKQAPADAGAGVGAAMAANGRVLVRDELPGTLAAGCPERGRQAECAGRFRTKAGA
ncbi:MULTISPECIES: complex I subunit 5 family protein [unclassified Thioalkalivibrio]|uniref:complex I subunit 5 family protein n=1 Tax=unclassified Thioalkalivibrio TaxID=2621013 RepID=UPI00036932E9|nr:MULTISPECIES: complex I subunit 5 family protein [unclassified Thioalkalivibrio]